MTQSRLPEGWDEERVQRVVSYYESQTEDEAVAEHEAAFADQMPDRSDSVCEFITEHEELIIIGRPASRAPEQKEWRGEWREKWRGLEILPSAVTSAS